MSSNGPELAARWADHERFWRQRAAAGLDPYRRSLSTRQAPEAVARNRDGTAITGLNFAALDPLALAAHPSIRAAAVDAIGRWGVHSTGPAALQGHTDLSIALECRLAELLGYPSVTLFPSGWAAAFSAIRTLTGQDDHVVLDAACHPAFADAACLATRNLHRTSHCAADDVDRRLAAIRAHDSRCAILVVTHILFALDSTRPDLGRLAESCRAHAATLLVDVAELFGLSDPATAAGTLAGADIVIGSLSHACVTNGGFVGCRSPALSRGMEVFATPFTQSSAPSPIQAAIALAALEIIFSAEGDRRRHNLAANARRLRHELSARAFRIPGDASPIVPIRFRTVSEARVATSEAIAGGALIELVEHPRLPRLEARWLLRPTADHTAEHIDRMAGIATQACEAARAILGQHSFPLPT